MDSENQCYICYDTETAETPYMPISPCVCGGSIILHISCYNQIVENAWKAGGESGKVNCSVCKTQYKFLKLVNMKQGEDGSMIVQQERKDKLVLEGPMNDSWNYNGEVLAYHDGKHVESMKMSNGIIDGLKMVYNYEGGQKYLAEIQHLDTQEKFHGVRKTFYAHGGHNRITSWNHGKLHGLSRGYMLSGCMNFASWSNNGIHEGVYQSWYENGYIKEIGTYEKGGKVGVHETFYENGQQMNYITYSTNGKRDGEYRSYYEDGQIQEQCMYKKGARDGEELKWHENGQLASQKFYKMGDRVGKHTEWYINGNLKSVYSYDENRSLLEGEYSKWYENGQPQEIGEYKHSDIGEITVWYKNGIIQSKKTYQNTICILSQIWYPSGQLCEYEDIVGEVRKYRKDGTLWFSGQYNKKAKKVGIWDITIYKKNNILEKESYFNPYNINFSSYEIDEKYPYKYHKIVHYSENGDVMKDLVWINDDLRKRFVKKDGNETNWTKETVESEPVLERTITTTYKDKSIIKKFQNGKLVEYYEK